MQLPFIYNTKPCWDPFCWLEFSCAHRHIHFLDPSISRVVDHSRLSPTQPTEPTRVPLFLQSFCAICCKSSGTSGSGSARSPCMRCSPKSYWHDILIQSNSYYVWCTFWNVKKKWDKFWRNFIHWIGTWFVWLHCIEKKSWLDFLSKAVNFSLNGRSCVVAIPLKKRNSPQKWTFSCRHLASLLLGCLWKKKSHHFPKFNLCTCLISLMAMTSISTILQPLPIDWHTPLLQWHLRQKERRAWCPARTHATCNNFSKMTTGKIPKILSFNCGGIFPIVTIQLFDHWNNPTFAVSKSLLLQSIHDVFVDVLRQSGKSSGCLEVKGVVIQSFLFYIKLYVLRSKLYQKTSK